MFAIFNFSLVVYAWLIIKETKGKSLEEMELGKFQRRYRRRITIANTFILVFNAKHTQIDLEGAQRKAKSQVESVQYVDNEKVVGKQ